MPAMRTTLSGHLRRPDAHLPTPCVQRWQVQCSPALSRKQIHILPNRILSGSSAMNIISGSASVSDSCLDEQATGSHGSHDSSTADESNGSISSPGNVSDPKDNGKVMVTFRYPAALEGQDVSVIGMCIFQIMRSAHRYQQCHILKVTPPFALWLAKTHLAVPWPTSILQQLVNCPRI